MNNATDTSPGKKYRPTRSKSFDLMGRAWLTRAHAGPERKAEQRLRMRRDNLTGSEVFMLAQLDAGAVLMRKHRRVLKQSGVGFRTVTEWRSIPQGYSLREVAS
jgi:hypothetical protein